MRTKTIESLAEVNRMAGGETTTVLLAYERDTPSGEREAVVVTDGPDVLRVFLLRHTLFQLAKSLHLSPQELAKVLLSPLSN